MRRLLGPAAALLAGALYPLALAPFDLWPMLLLTVALWGALLAGGAVGPWTGGWLLALGRYGTGVSWVYVSISEHTTATPLFAATLTGLFVLGLSLLGLLHGGLTAAALRLASAGPGRPVATALALAAGWFAFEWTLTWLLTGFPWLYAGYAATDTAVSGWAPLLGTLGTGWLLVFPAALAGTLAVAALRLRFASAAATGPRAPWARGRDDGAAVGGSGPAPGPGGLARATALLVAFGAVVAAGGLVLRGVPWTEPSGAPLSVALVQGAIPQAEKWQPGTYGWIVGRHLELTEPHWGADVIVWPEAAITRFQHQAAPLLEALDERGRVSGSTVVAGIPAWERTGEGEGSFRNSAVALGTGAGRYDKRRLVPFGEYVPLEHWLRGLIDLFDLPMSRSRPGPWEQAPLTVAGQLAAIAICYEIVYGELVRESARDAALIVTISNDAWFGDSIGPYQHQQMARMRALELRKPVLRATNDGITALIAFDGRVIGRLPRFEPAVLTGTITPRTGSTPYGRLGDAPAAALALGLLALRMPRRRRAP
jgi:apolipoprotein N-acyltransferase